MRITAMEAARRALEFHIQPTIPFGGQRDANDIARVGNRKTREVRVGKDRAAFGLGNDVRQLAGAVQHKQQFCEKRSGR